MTSEPKAVQGPNSAGGLPCPKCRNPISFSLPTLLQSPVLHCQACGLELTIDIQKSEAALLAARKLANELDSIDRP